MLCSVHDDAFMRILLLEDFNTRIVVVGTILLGAAAGLIGTFLLLRKRALMGDVLSHTMLPGIVITFLIFAGMETAKSQATLLVGAGIAAGLGVLVEMCLDHAQNVVFFRTIRKQPSVALFLRELRLLLNAFPQQPPQSG